MESVLVPVKMKGRVHRTVLDKRRVHDKPERT